VEIYGRAEQATNGNTIQRMRFACWINKATDTHLKYVTHCFCTASVVTCTCHNIMFISTFPVVFFLCMCVLVCQPICQKVRNGESVNAGSIDQ
jgi:hypothetical protein